MDSKYKLSAAEETALSTLGNKVMAQVTLNGGGWVVQKAKVPNPIPAIEGWEKLLEIPTVGTMQFLDDFWNYWIYATEAEARAANPEFEDGNYFIRT